MRLQVQEEDLQAEDEEGSEDEDGGKSDEEENAQVAKAAKSMSRQKGVRRMSPIITRPVLTRPYSLSRKPALSRPSRMLPPLCIKNRSHALDSLKNFMCHAFFETHFNPQINFIIGHNGSQ